MDELDIRLFGKACIQKGAETITSLTLKSQELLFYLLLHQDSPHTREALAYRLWQDASDLQAKKYLRQTLWHIQTVLDNPSQPLFIVDNNWIQFNPTSCLSLDVFHFMQAFKLTQDDLGQGLSPDQAETMHQAIELYSGELLTGWYQDWCVLERERFQAMYLAMLDKLTVYAIVNRQYESGIEYGMRMLRTDYAREKTHRRLMRLYYLSGDRTMALRQYERCVAILGRELSVKPTNKTKLLYEEILADQLSEWPQPAQQRGMVTVSPKGESQMFHKLEQIASHLLRLGQEIESIKQALGR